MSFSNPANFQPATITGVFQCGETEDEFSGESIRTVILRIETPDRIHFIRDTLPVQMGSPLHRLYEGATGYSYHAQDVVIAELVGRSVMLSIVPSETWSVVRNVKPFPAPPRHQAPGLIITSSHPKLTGLRNGATTQIGGQAPKRQPEFPAPPEPRTAPIVWDVASLRLPVMPEGLPPVVVALVQRSREWRELSEAPAPVTRRK